MVYAEYWILYFLIRPLAIGVLVMTSGETDFRQSLAEQLGIAPLYPRLCFSVKNSTTAVFLFPALSYNHSMLTLRPEIPADIPAIRQVNELAFGRPDEAKLVDKLRDAAAITLSLVAVQHEQVVGHALFSPVTIVAEDGSVTPAVALGPIAVHPAWQNQGVGGALIRQGLAECQSAGYGLMIVLGHRDYYPKFGFVAAANHNIHYTQPLPEGVFMVAELQPQALATVQGIVHYHPAFADV